MDELLTFVGFQEVEVYSFIGAIVLEAVEMNGTQIVADYGWRNKRVESNELISAHHLMQSLRIGGDQSGHLIRLLVKVVISVPMIVKMNQIDAPLRISVDVLAPDIKRPPMVIH